MSADPTGQPWDELRPAEQQEAFERLRQHASDLSWRSGLDLTTEVMFRLHREAQRRHWYRDKGGKMMWVIR